MRIGIIGGGLMGVALGYFLSRNGSDEITILEQGAELGGLNSEIIFEGGLRVARYQHSILPTDHAVYDLCEQLGLQDDLVFSDVHTGFIHEGQIQPLTNLLDFLTFPILSLRDRARMAGQILRARRMTDWSQLDITPVRQWLIRTGGTQSFERVWKPLLEAKFDGVYDNVSAAYICSWLNRMSSVRRSPRLAVSAGYLRRGHFSLILAMSEAFIRRGGIIQTGVRVREIELTDGRLGRIRTHEGALEFDALIVALATPALAPLIPGAEPSFLTSLKQVKYLGLICPVMLLDRPLSPYWTLQLTDPSLPFATIIETPHPENPDLHIVYLPRYTAPDNDWMGVSDTDIRDAWLQSLKSLFPAFDLAHIRHFAVSRSRYAEPVFSVNSRATMPGVETSYKGLFLVNSSQTYPELPTSETTIVHAREAVNLIRQYQPVPAVPA